MKFLTFPLLSLFFFIPPSKGSFLEDLAFKNPKTSFLLARRPPIKPSHLSGKEGLRTRGGLFSELEMASEAKVRETFLAIRKGRWGEVKTLIERGEFDINGLYKGQTLLREAIRKGHFKTVKLLVAKGADLNYLGRGHYSYVVESIRSARMDILEFLLKNGANSGSQGLMEHTALHHAAAKGNEPATNLLLKYKVPVDHSIDYSVLGDPGKITPFTVAIIYGHIGVARALAQAGANVNIKGQGKKTPLHHAVEVANMEAVKFLVEELNVNFTKDTFNRTPLDIAFFKKKDGSKEHEKILDFFKEKGLRR